MDFEKHEFLSAYMTYVKNTETPRLCHLWSALSAVSACLGRRCWIETGIGNVWPNMYIIISGPPGGRKSSAINYARDLLAETTTIRFAPDDTGGQRQGIITAMTDTGDEEIDKEDFSEILKELQTETYSGIVDQEKKNGSNGVAHALERLGNLQFDTRDPRTMYICSGEVKSFLGENNSQMLTFLIRMFDGDSYEYKLRNSTYVVRDGLLGIIGATTPSEIALMLPPGAMGSGFTSRIIFVHATGRNRRIPEPTLDKSVRPFLCDVFTLLFDKFNGAFSFSPKARDTYNQIYCRGIELKDPRFMHYCERRHTHLQKTAMAIAASAGRQTLEHQDIEMADALLRMTEVQMPDALGEFGMNKTSISKSKLLEFIQSMDTGIPLTLLFSMMSRDMSRMEFENTITELHNGGKITHLNVPGVGLCVTGVSDSPAKRARQELNELKRFLG